jgi:hypothetical protein
MSLPTYLFASLGDVSVMAQSKPNILILWGDDIGIWNIR